MNLLSLKSLKKYILSVLMAFAITLFLLAVISIIFSFCSPGEALLRAISDYCFAFTVFLSAFFSGRATGKKGIITGLIALVFCFLIFFLVGKTVFKSDNLIPVLLKNSPIVILCGAIGGILGVNSK